MRHAPGRSLVLAIGALLGCDPPPDDEDEPQPVAVDDGDDDPPAASACADETRDDDYALGLAKAGARMTVTFVDAMPAPPARGDNTWRVAITDVAGAPLSGLQLAVDPYMPDHQHGTSIATHVDEADTPGHYVLAPVNLFMPGLWEVTIAASGLQGGDDAVVFRFCVDP
ncbi:MAG: FixH family protein [Nannocystaceae bacterium]